jgi:flagellar biosynthesis chaperone FliJ
MTHFSYRLQTLLEQKEHIRKDCENEKLRRGRELEAEETKLVELQKRQKELEDKREKLRRELFANTEQGPPTAQDVTNRRAYVKVVEQQIEDAKSDVFAQRQVIEDCKALVEKAKRRVEEARREVEVLEKHRAKQEERFRRILQAKEDLELDEVGNVLYSTRRRQT